MKEYKFDTDNLKWRISTINSDASKSDREKLNRMLEEMFEESDMWLVSE